MLANSGMGVRTSVGAVAMPHSPSTRRTTGEGFPLGLMGGGGKQF